MKLIVRQFAGQVAWHSVIAALCLVLLHAAPARIAAAQQARATWTADNGNGTFTNPLFYEEFSDPDLIRVGNDFYMTGTTMHTMPGLPVLHSRDLVNWTLLSYAFDRLDLGPAFRLEDGADIYGQGIWAPSIRYHDGTFYIFSNINGVGTQVFSATDPAGPWEHRQMDGGIHDSSVLFDDDGTIYAVYGYDEVRLVELKPDLSGIVEGSERVIIPAGNAMGEGHHFYKIDGRYYIISANYSPVGSMQCARADRPEGPYETVVISARETSGTQRGWWTTNAGAPGSLSEGGFEFELVESGANEFGATTLHQGGVVDLPNGDWWGFSMLDFRSLGRTTFLSPVTWHDGWPYFGLLGNLGRTPRTWVKPDVDAEVAPTSAFQRDDEFAGPKLRPIWQWNHVPADDKWSLREREGVLRLHTLPAPGFFQARNTLTQRAAGPESIATTVLDASGLEQGDFAGLALLNLPGAWLGVAQTAEGPVLRFYDQYTDQTIERPLPAARVHLRAQGTYDEDIAQLSYSTDGTTFEQVGDTIRLGYQLKTFQGVRYALFAYNTAGREGGYADFEAFRVDEPLADRSGNIPVGKVITLTNLANGRAAWANPHGMLHAAAPSAEAARGPGVRFRVHDRGQGRVALEAMDGSGFVTVVGLGLPADVRLMDEESEGSLFQWQDMLRNQCMLLSLKTNRYVGLDPATGEPYAADRAGAHPDRRHGAVFVWEEVPGAGAQR